MQVSSTVEGVVGSGGGGAGAEQVQDLVQAELSAWTAVLDGSAIDDHMEDVYLANLTAALAALTKRQA